MQPITLISVAAPSRALTMTLTLTSSGAAGAAPPTTRSSPPGRAAACRARRPPPRPPARRRHGPRGRGPSAAPGRRRGQRRRRAAASAGAWSRASRNRPATSSRAAFASARAVPASPVDTGLPCSARRLASAVSRSTSRRNSSTTLSMSSCRGRATRAVDLLVGPLAQPVFLLAQGLLAGLHAAPPTRPAPRARGPPGAARGRGCAGPRRSSPGARPAAPRAPRCCGAPRRGSPGSGRAARRSRAPGCGPACRTSAGRSARTSRDRTRTPRRRRRASSRRTTSAARSASWRPRARRAPRKWSTIAMPSAPPSTGSVPAPTSSSSTSAGSASDRSIWTMFVMCHEKVLRLAAIDCSSPMSANTDRNTGSRDPCSAGTCSPACAISASRPAVLSATVLPPVFGPVMTSTVVPGISLMSTGTGPFSGAFDAPPPPSPPLADAARASARRWATAGISSGCRAASSSNAPSPASAGSTPPTMAESRAFAWMTSSSVRRLDRALQIERPAPELVRQREQDAPDLLGFLLLERHDVVVDLDGAQRLEEQAGAARRTAVDDARDGRAVLGAHHQHEAAVAVGDDLVLQVLRRVAAAQERLERAPQARPLPPQALAHRLQLGAGVVGHLARGLDLVPGLGDLAAERRPALGQGLQDGKGVLGPADGGAGGVDRLEELGQAQQAQRFEGPALDGEARENRRQVGRRRQREAAHQFVEPHALGGRGEQLGHLAGVGQRPQPGQALGAERRDGAPAQHIDDVSELERLKDGCVHTCRDRRWRGRVLPGCGRYTPRAATFQYASRKALCQAENATNG